MTAPTLMVLALALVGPPAPSPEAPEAPAAGPAPDPAPTPSPEDLRRALAGLPTTPTLEQVQRAAMARAQLHPGDARRWLRRARAAALLPTVAAGYDLRLDRGWSLDREPGVPDALQNDTGNVSTVRLKVSWELDRALFNPDELRAARSALDLADWRERVLIDVTRLYFERMGLLLERTLALDADLSSALERELRLREVEGVLQGLTGLRGPWPQTDPAPAPAPARPGP